MKARKLKKILNDTQYTVHETREHVCVGSPLCSELFTVDKKTLKIKYALDAFREGRAAFKYKSEELLFIWDKLHELVESGEIKELMEGEDILENPLPVFAVEDGELISTHTDKYGWPNTTKEGKIMYDNSWFKDQTSAIEYGIRQLEYFNKSVTEHIQELEDKIAQRKTMVKDNSEKIENLKQLL